MNFNYLYICPEQPQYLIYSSCAQPKWFRHPTQGEINSCCHVTCIGEIDELNLAELPFVKSVKFYSSEQYKRVKFIKDKTYNIITVGFVLDEKLKPHREYSGELRNATFIYVSKL